MEEVRVNGLPARLSAPSRAFQLLQTSHGVLEEAVNLLTFHPM